MKLTIRRQVSIGEFEYDQVTIEEEVDSREKAGVTVQAMREMLDVVLPASPDRFTPAPQPAPIAAPPVYTAPPTFGAPVMTLQVAESLPCPCGPTINNPLGTLTDKDLVYLRDKYKKDESIRTAASIVLAARAMGQTTKK